LLSHLWEVSLWASRHALPLLTRRAQARRSFACDSNLRAGSAPSLPAPRDLAELFRALYDETARVMDATVFLFALYDEASETVQVVRQMDRGVEHSGGFVPPGQGFHERGEFERVRLGSSADGPPRDARPSPLRHRGGGTWSHPKSGVVVPILSGDRVLGVLSAQSYRPEAYEDADLLSLSAIAAQAGITIQRLRVTEQMALEHERHASELEAVLATMNDGPPHRRRAGAIVRLNRAAERRASMTGRGRGDFTRVPATARGVAARVAGRTEARALSRHRARGCPIQSHDGAPRVDDEEGVVSWSRGRPPAPKRVARAPGPSARSRARRWIVIPAWRWRWRSG